MDILNHRLANQQISVHQFSKPEELVFWLGALQAQDYAMAKWGIGCRLAGITETQVEKDFNEGKILRTHVMRPTWHFVSPNDIRWMLELTAPRIRTFAKGYHNALGIDSGILKRSKRVIEKALAADGPMTRNEIQKILSKSRINTKDIRLSFLLMDAELDGLICSAGRKGNQFAYGLLDKIVPEHKILQRAEAVTVLAKRYFEGHGPATMHDFAWWSSLPLLEIKEALSSLKSELVSENLNGQTYWFSGSKAKFPVRPKENYFLPAFDEYVIGYKDRGDLIDPSFSKRIMTTNGIFNPIHIKNGKAAGTWKRTEQKSGLLIKLSPFSDSIKPADRALTSAINKYFQFMGRRGIIVRV